MSDTKPSTPDPAETGVDEDYNAEDPTHGNGGGR